MTLALPVFSHTDDNAATRRCYLNMTRTIRLLHDVLTLDSFPQLYAKCMQSSAATYLLENTAYLVLVTLFAIWSTPLSIITHDVGCDRTAFVCRCQTQAG